MTSFVGLDLSWTGKYPSGLCIFSGNHKNISCTTVTTEQLTTFELMKIINSFEEEIIISVDAPLVTTEQRQAEKILMQLFGKAKAPAYPATPKILERFNFCEGPKLAKLLKENLFELDPHNFLLGLDKKKVAFETYTHAAHIRLFGLTERIPYKRRKGRNINFIKNELQRYQDYMQEILTLEAPGILTNEKIGLILKASPVEKATGTTLKRIEDTLDGLTCALVSYLFWRDGNSHWEALGSLPDGCVVVPKLGAYTRK